MAKTRNPQRTKTKVEASTRSESLEERVRELERHIDFYALAGRLWQCAALFGVREKGKVRVPWQPVRELLAAELRVPEDQLEGKVSLVPGVRVEGETLVLGES